MTILHVLFWNLLAPAAVSATAIATSRRIGRGAPIGPRGRWGVAVGLGLGYLAGHVGLLGWPAFPTLDAVQTVAWLALAASTIGVVEASWTWPGWATWSLRAAFTATLLGLLLRSKVELGWTAFESAGWLLAFWVGILASWWNLEAQAERLTGPGWLVPLMMAAAGWGAVQGLSDSAEAVQLEGVLAASLLGALLTVGLRPGLMLSKGGPAVAATVLTGLGLTGYFYSNVPALSALLLAVAPWTPWIDRIGFIRRRSYWTRASIRGLAVLLTVGAAIIVAVAGSIPPAGDEPSL